LLANCVIYYNACILPQLLDHAEGKGDCGLADRIKSISPVRWKHVNFCGEYTFRYAGGFFNLDRMVSRLAALEWKSPDEEQAD